MLCFCSPRWFIIMMTSVSFRHMHTGSEVITQNKSSDLWTTFQIGGLTSLQQGLNGEPSLPKKSPLTPTVSCLRRFFLSTSSSSVSETGALMAWSQQTWQLHQGQTVGGGLCMSQVSWSLVEININGLAFCPFAGFFLLSFSGENWGQAWLFNHSFSRSQ